MTNLLLLSANDRFNYGDLLFPVLLHEFFCCTPEIAEVIPYSIRRSDFSAQGGVKTLGMRDLFRDLGANRLNVLLLAGGGIVGARWAGMHRDMLGPASAFIYYYLGRILGNEFMGKVSQLYFGSPSEYPWVIGSRDLINQNPIIYNAVGGSELERLSVKQRHRWLDKIATASYVSVRDKKTYELFRERVPDRILHLVPDSAAIMSTFYDEERLNELDSTYMRGIGLEKGHYIIFQCDRALAESASEGIAQQLDNFATTRQMPIILLPIGRYRELGDEIGLRHIQAKLKSEAFLVSSKTTIFEIMSIIAKSAIFIGTSLHGNITAQAFSVPHVGLSESRNKLSYYLESWDIGPQSSSVRSRYLEHSANEVLNIEKVTLEQNRRYLAEKSMNSLFEIRSIITKQNL